ARIGALISTTLIAKGSLADSEYHTGISGLFSTRTVIGLFKDADCLIAVGSGLNARTTEGGHLYPNARIIHVDVAPHLVMGNHQGADCYIQGDAAATIEELESSLAEKEISHTGYRTAEVRKALHTVDRDPAEFEIEPGTVDPREAMRIMDERLPANV